MKSSSDVLAGGIGNIYLNALAITLSNKVLTVEIESNKDVYSKHVKPWLKNTDDIAYWTPRRKPEAKDIYISYVTSINSSIDSVKARLEELKDRISIKGETYLTINRNSVKMLEGAVMKRFITVGWRCPKPKRRYGNIVCWSSTPLDSKYLFAFHRAVEFRVIYIDAPLLVLRPHLHIVGPSLKDLLNQFGESLLQKVTNRECIALRKNEDRPRKAMILEVKKADIDRYVAKVIFYDGFEDEVNIEDVRLAGNVLFYKKLVIELFGEQAYRQLEKMRRGYSFSLGPRESSLKLAKAFKDEILNVVRNSGVFPFKLGDVNVDIELDLIKVT